MESIRLKNYRCFEDTNEISIKPLTFLLGANSSGKSSFLKIFPLIKQSMGIRLNGLFLWCGDEVDFNNFSNTVRHGKKEMELWFKIKDLRLVRDMNYRNTKVKNVEIGITVEESKEKGFDYIKKLIFKLEEVSIMIDFNSSVQVKRISIGESVWYGDEDKIFSVITTGLLPKILFESKNSGLGEYPTEALERIDQFLADDVEQSNARRIYLQSFKKLNDVKQLEKFILSEFGGTTSHNVSTIINLLYYYNINNIIDSINLYFLAQGRNIRYVQPLRATTKRYYRFQNYSVEEIDSDGRNLPMFFNSLSQKSMDSFNAWLNEMFDFTLELKRNEGSIELKVIEKDKESRNMVDIGFGYTQILPILTIIWKVTNIDSATNSNNYCNNYIIAIEQPELHLHPRFQGMFADLLSKTINWCKSKRRNVRFVIETHSPTIINRVGELVGTKDLSSEDLSVLLFNADKEGFNQYVLPTSFSSEGYLNSWPYGFFDYYGNRSVR